jgi:subtilisin family serine protease
MIRLLLTDQGQGITVASIDTGVEWTHPALTKAYRGKHSDGTVDHNYNWYDPSRTCPSAQPCDNDDHGTHTMGTMVGDDGTHRIGVAPGARWIAAKGCSSSGCPESSLLAAGEWMLAPTDLSGANPRPDLAPDVVNNSWGAQSVNPFYTDIVSSWVAAGIFPSFSNGNAGPGCATTGSPAGYVDSYASGAFDVTNTISDFSSRGYGVNGVVKPNIAAPGEEVNSSVPGGFDIFSGTSMAAPHTSATVALMWSVSPSIRGNVAETRAILDRTAIDVPDTGCGGTPGKNLTYGEGRLDAYAAVLASPRAGTGTLRGTVTAAGAPLADAQVSIGGESGRSSTTGTDGSYLLTGITPGNYQVTVSKLGYRTEIVPVTIVVDAAATADVVLTVVPRATLSGTIRAAQGPAGGAKVTLADTPISVTAGPDGRYSLTAPQGTYQLAVTSPIRCADGTTQRVELGTAATFDIMLPARTDAFGYACTEVTGAYPSVNNRLPLRGDDDSYVVTLPFPVPFYGQVYNTATVSIDGNITFGDGRQYNGGYNVALPATSQPNGALYPFWDDLYIPADGPGLAPGVYTGVTGNAPHRFFTFEWRDVQLDQWRGELLTFAAQLGEDGTIIYRYQMDKWLDDSATIGLEDPTGTIAFQYSYNELVIRYGTVLGFRAPRSARPAPRRVL